MKTPDTAILAATLALRHAGAHNLPQYAARDAADLCTLGKRATSIATRDCNGAIDPDKADRSQAAIRGKADAILKPYGLRSSTTGDPRGYCLRLFPMDGAAPLPGNTWGGDESGYGV